MTTSMLSPTCYSQLLLWFFIPIIFTSLMVQGEPVSRCYVEGAPRRCIDLSDNGPVTLDTPITFTVKNSYRTIEPSYEYRFKFDQFPHHDKTIVSTSDEVLHSVIFESSSAPYAHYYRVHLDVWYCHLGKPVSSIGAAYQSFILLDSIVGFIDVSQDIDEESLVNNFVSTTSPVNLTAKIHDPSGFFASVNITYKWIVNGSPQEESYGQFIIQNFTQPQINNISVIVSATTLQKSGLFEISLQSKDPIHNLTADGHTSVELFKGESLQLNVKINGGTPPFSYCWEITNSTTPRETIKPLSESFIWLRFSEEEDWRSKCNKTDESSFNINSHFEEAGNKTLYIDVHNYVSTSTKIITISVHERELLRQPEANKPAVIQESSNIMKKYKPVMLSSEPEIYDKEIESYLRSKNEIEFINDMQTDFQNSSWKD